MVLTDEDQPVEGKPCRNAMIEYMRAKHPQGGWGVGTASFSHSEDDETVWSEMLRVMRGIDDGTIGTTIHEHFHEPAAVQTPFCDVLAEARRAP